MSTIEKLFEDNMNLAHWCVAKHFPTLLSSEDVHQEALLGLWRACRTYNSSKGSFSSYAVPCVLNSIRMYLRKENRNPLNASISLESEINDAEGLYLMDCLEDPLGSPENSGVFFSSFINGLSPRDRQVLLLRVKGLSQKQAAKHMGFSQSYYSRLLKKVRDKCLKYAMMGVK